jgi:thioredoxin reductase
MTDSNNFDVIIIGGSYSGLSAGMALGRSLRKVLIIDSGLPCNRQTPYSHNFLTQDGKSPQEISTLAKQQVAKYDTVIFYDGLAIDGSKTKNGFTINTQTGDVFAAKKLILATGIKDIMPDIPGLAECWGISVIHCPYCHGYEVKGENTGILDNGDSAFHYAQMVNNLTKRLTIFTNGKPSFTSEQLNKLEKHSIQINELEIDKLEHLNGHIQNIIFRDGSKTSIDALYAKIPFVQNSNLLEAFGCELIEQGFIKVDAGQKTSVEGIYACGDNSTMMRSIGSAVASGNLAGAMANRELCEEEFSLSS